MELAKVIGQVVSILVHAADGQTFAAKATPLDRKSVV